MVSSLNSLYLILSLIVSSQAFLQGSRHLLGTTCCSSSCSLRISARKRKEELDLMLSGKEVPRLANLSMYATNYSYLSGMGLEPARKANNTPTKQPSQQISPHRPPNISLRNQLDYARNGHTALNSLIDPELLLRVRTDVLRYTSQKALDAWRQKVEVASDSPKLAQSCRTIEECQDELEKLGIEWDFLPFLQSFNTWRNVPSVKALCFALGETASTLMDVPSVRLYQDSVFSKRAQDGPTPWHTDARMAPFDTPHMITIWIPLQDIPKDGTALVFVSKSHSDFALPFWNDFDGPEFDRLEERYKGVSISHMPLKLGDATAHSGWTLHCADGNDSSDDRHALAISFVDTDAQVRETALDFKPSSGGYGDNEDQWSYREWVNSVKPRTHFSHDLVPIVWPLK